MVIEQGNYDAFKRCTFRLLDYGRIANVVEALNNWGLADKFELTLTDEWHQSSSVVLWFRYNFPGKSVSGVFDYFYLKLGKATDTVLWHLCHEGVTLYDYDSGADNHWRYPVGHDGSGTGRVAFLVEVPYPCLLDDETDSRCAER